MKPSLSHCASQETGRTLSLEPAVEKGIRFSLHFIREAMPRREKNGLEPFRHSFLGIVVLRFRHQGTHSIDGEEGVGFSRRQQKGAGGQGHYQRVPVTNV